MLKLSSRWQPLPLLGMMAAALMAGSMAHGQTFSTGAGATASDGKPVSATATFHVTQGNVQIDVQNLIFNPTAVSQNISDLFFTISTPQTIGTLSGTGASGSVASGGAFTSEGTVSVTPAWVMDPFNNTLGFHLDALGGGQPKYTILGLPDAGGLYSNANGSIAGNGTHNPFFVGDVTFNVAIAGVTTDTHVTGATFSFGTTPGDNVPGGGGPPQGNMTPEGSSLFLMAPGLLPVVWFGIRRRFAKNV